MNPSEINSLVRELLKTLINEKKFKKSAVCAVTFGTQSGPLINKIIKENKDIGHKPLTRFFKAFDYDLHFVPVKQDDLQSKEYIDSLAISFINEISTSLIEFLEKNPNFSSTSSKRGGKVGKMIEKRVDEYMSEIGLS